MGVALVLTGCGGGHSTPARPAPHPTTTTVAPTTVPTTPPALAPGSRAVGVRSGVYVDTTRPTPPNGDAPGAPTRRMPTMVWHRGVGAPTLLPVPNATPDVRHGPYPLVVFAHGFAVTPETYGALLARWASAGYVVVAPEIPLLNGDAPGGASHADYGAPNIEDLDFVVGEALRRAATPGDPLAGLIDPARVAVAGHSDGEVLAYALGFEPCCHDPRVRAVIAMAGNLANAEVLPAPTGIPILHVLADHDQYDPYPASIAFDRQHLPAPSDFLTLVGATHLDPFSQPTDPHFDLVTLATVDFLNATLNGHPEALTALQSLVSAAPTLATLKTNPASPPAP